MISFPASQILTIVAFTIAFIGALGARPLGDSGAPRNNDGSITVKVAGTWLR